MNRWKNYGLWISFASLLLIILQTFNVNIAPEQYTTLVNGILSFLIAAGIINNPTTTNRGFTDDYSSEETKE